MGKVIFFGLGVGATIMVMVQVRKFARKASPAGVQEAVRRRSANAGDQVGSFLDTFSSASAEREAQLQAMFPALNPDLLEPDAVRD